ncbi:MAG: hypothetical protein IPL46_21640 [Saprospiraceae bacterium]|nr:hypothetical protein [Saprospiraceae bacterium]
MDKLRSLDLVRLGLAKLNDGAEWTNSNKRKNLINAFAEIYDAEFTNGETFDIFENMDRSHLEEVMFNATEFRTGIIFRFQSGGRFGNFHQSAKKSIWGEVKLADVIAASSCFTGGFEPIEWPRDFVHSEALNLAEEAPLMHSAGLMDGGIYDNQGLDSILLSENRVASEPYDLIIASDVTSPYMNPFKFLDDKGDKGWRKWNYASVRSRIIKWYSRMKWGLLVLFFISAMYLLMNWSDSLTTGIFLSLGLLAVILLLLMSRIKKKISIYLSDAKEYLEKSLPMTSQLRI